MKKLLPIVLLLLSFNALANTLTFDPTLPTDKQLTLTCNYTLEREDGSVLAIGEIAKVKFYVEKNGDGVITPAGENQNACRKIYDMSQVVDGDYVYTATQVDMQGRESKLSIDTATAIVKRLPNPRSPTGMVGTKG